jgi:hypothetical protein
MLSTQNKTRLFLGLVFTAVLFAGTAELRIAVGTIFSWVLSHIILRRSALPDDFRRVHNIYIFVSFWLLAAFNDPFYENTFGRFLNLFFERYQSDPDVPGSGFTNWHERFRRRNQYEIDLTWRFLRAAIGWTLAAASLPVLVPLVHWMLFAPCPMAELERALAYAEKTGEFPPWQHKQRKPEIAVARRDTRYCRLDDNHIFACGPGGGLETVADGDIEGAISRRRELGKRFA